MNKPHTAHSTAAAASHPSTINSPSLRSVKHLIPFMQPQTVKNGYKMGRGIVLILSCTANTDTTLNHILGRIPNWLIVLDAGVTYTPKWRRSSVTAWTTNTATVQFDTAVAALTVWVI